MEEVEMVGIPADLLREIGLRIRQGGFAVGDGLLPWRLGAADTIWRARMLRDQPFLRVLAAYQRRVAESFTLWMRTTL
jgi:hypothetical protein